MQLFPIDDDCYELFPYDDDVIAHSITARIVIKDDRVRFPLVKVFFATGGSGSYQTYHLYIFFLSPLAQGFITPI